MNSNRIEQLFQFLKEDPGDPFILYAIATEYLKTDEQKTLGYYIKLLTEHENYTGTYYHAAKLYEKMGDYSKAEEIYKKGMEVCRKNNKTHALNELQRAYREFLDNQIE